MPRVSPREIARAARLHPLLGQLMGVCRSVDVAKRELRWMEDEILRLDVKTANRFLEKYRLSSVRPETFGGGIIGKWEKLLLAKFVEERAKGTPFQYVVENQPFGTMTMHVRSGVFIPRWETEEWTLALASRLRLLTPSRQAFTLVDLCTGSGCIPLLLKNYVSANIDKGLYSKYGKPKTAATFIGVEKDEKAITVARRNLKNTQSQDQRFLDPTMYFIHNDIHSLPPNAFQGRVDIITCNPPYIPLRKRLTIDHSVSQHEPHQALFVPSHHGDDYYHTLLSIANRWESPAIVTEVGDLAQAERVKSLFENDHWESSIWLDSTGEGRVVVAVKSQKWTFLLPQPDYSVPLDISPFPREEKPRWAQPGSIVSRFRRPKAHVAPRLVKNKGEKEMGFVDRMIAKLRKHVQDDEDTDYLDYLENLRKKTK